MSEQKIDRELGWDERIESPNEGEYTIFPEGIYPFTIVNFERGRHTETDKLPACNKAIVSIEFDGGPQLGTTIIKHQLFLHTKCTGLLSQFFRGIGLRKHGDPLVLNWSAIPGRKGYAKLGTREFDKREYPDIKRFLDPEDWPSRTPTQVAPSDQSAAQVQQPLIPISGGDDIPF